MRNDIWESPVEDIARGFGQDGQGWRCLLCGQRFEEGVVYTVVDGLFEARRAAAEHVKEAHGSVFQYLMEAGSKYHGLTPHQGEVLSLMREGLTDKAIAQRASSGNPAVIRNLRFQLKEREKQAKALLAVMEAFRLESLGAAGREPVVPHAGATMADERFDYTPKERDAVLKLYFTGDGRLKEFPAREKRKVIVLGEIAQRFEPVRTYTEPEVNGIIDYEDFATVRRYLVEYGFLQRSADCREYRRKEGI